MKTYKLIVIILILLMFIPLIKAEDLNLKKSAVLNELYPDGFYDTVNFYVGVWSSNEGSKIERTLLKFNISGLEGNNINKAVLNLEVRLEADITSREKQVLEVHKVLEDWDKATWNNQPDVGGVIGFVEITDDGLYEVDVTDLVQSWVIEPSSNYGVLLKAQDEDVINLKEFTRNSKIEVIVEGELTECERNGGSCKYSCSGDELEIDYSCDGAKCCRAIKKPDLIVEDIRFIDLGENVYDIYAVFKNIGVVYSYSDYYDYEATLNEGFLSAATNLEPLRPEEGIEIPIGAKELTGIDVVKVIVDSSDKVDESNERNNEREEQIVAAEVKWCDGPEVTNPSIKNYCVDSNGVDEYDSCVDENNVREGYCYIDECRSTIKECLAGYVCEDGACIKKCAKEGEYTSGPVSPEYQYECCEGLEGYNTHPLRVGTGVLCYDPDKGIPVCKHIGTSSEGWYYSNGELLRYEICGREPCIEEGGTFSGAATSNTCCEGLTAISNLVPDIEGNCPISTDEMICVNESKLGNYECDEYEYDCNVPEDCFRCHIEGENVHIHPKNKCCPSLEEVPYTSDVYMEGVCVNNRGMFGYWCLKCGDGVCEESKHENPCLCPEDCSWDLACIEEGGDLGPEEGCSWWSGGTITVLSNVRECCEGLSPVLPESHYECQSGICKPSNCADSDNDGYYAISADCEEGDDCDDSNVNVNPSAVEDCSDYVDNDCDGLVDMDDEDCEVGTETEGKPHYLEYGECMDRNNKVHKDKCYKFLGLFKTNYLVEEFCTKGEYRTRIKVNCKKEFGKDYICSNGACLKE